jgi:hypothetical protein
MQGRAFLILAIVVSLTAGIVGCADQPPSQPVATAPLEKDNRTLGAEHGPLKLYTEEVEPWKLRLSFENAPEYVHALEMAPAAREPVLDQGDWLVLVVATWSVPDVRCILTAIESLEKQKHNLRLGVRLFGDYQEIKVWYPEYDGTAATPLWVCYSGGKVVGARSGVLSADEITGLVKTCFRK